MASVYEMARQRNTEGIDLVACAALQREIALRQKRNDEKKPERKAQHKKWAHTEAGKASMKRRGARYRATYKGRQQARKKSLNYYRRHKDDPEFKARKMELRKKWLKEHPEQAKAIRHHSNVLHWAKVKKGRLRGDYVLWTMDGVIKVRLAG